MAIKGCSIIIQLLLIPLTIGYVSTEVYGIWLTLSSIMVWLNFFDVGFTLGLKNKLTEAIALEDWQKGRSLVSTTYFMMIVIFIPLTIILEFLVPHINWYHFLNINVNYNQEVTNVVQILVAFIGLNMIFNVLTAVVSAFQKVALSTAFNVIGQFVSLFIIFVLTKTVSPSLVSLALAMSVPSLLVLSIASIFLYSSSFILVRPSVKQINYDYIKELFTLGYKFFIIQIQFIVLYQSTNILISNITGPNDVTIYNVAYKYLSVGMLVFNIILGPLWPAITDAYTKKDFIWMKSIYSKIKKIYLLMALLIIIMVAISPVVYKIWVGSHVNMPFLFSLLTGLYLIVNMWDGLQISIINGTGKIKLQSYITILGLLVHIPLSLFLGHWFYSYGVVISMIIVTSIYSIIFTLQAHKLMSCNATGIWNL